MKKTKIAVSFMAVLISIPCAAGFSAQKSGRDIAVLVDERPDGKDRKMQMKMTLINRRGRTRVREMVSYSKDYGKDSKTLFYFRQPADVKGVGFLTWDYNNPRKDDDKWLYLPALRKVKRISGSSKNDSFMGSDLTYDDMGDRAVDEDRHKFLREGTVDGHECWVIESVPVDKDYMYSKVVSWVRKDALVRVKSVFYDRQNRLLKTMKKTGLKKHSGFWVAFRTEVENVQDSHRTVFELSDVVFDSGISGSLFRVSTLKRGKLR